MKRIDARLQMLCKALTGLCLTLMLIPQIAYASIATSNTKTTTVNGISYNYYSTVSISSNLVAGRGWVRTTSGNSAPTGYMGVKAFIYTTASSNPVAYVGYTFNSSAVSGMGIAAKTSFVSGNTYYAKANIALYNGNTYNYYVTYQTPYVQTNNGTGEILSGADEPLKPTEMVINGKTDLVIRATGINGREGYITYTDVDMYYVPSSPEEAVAYTASQPDLRYIPVYDSDGRTVIDEFPVYGGYNGDIIVIP